METVSGIDCFSEKIQDFSTRLAKCKSPGKELQERWRTTKNEVTETYKSARESGAKSTFPCRQNNVQSLVHVENSKKGPKYVEHLKASKHLKVKRNRILSSDSGSSTANECEHENINAVDISYQNGSSNVNLSRNETRRQHEPQLSRGTSQSFKDHVATKREKKRNVRSESYSCDKKKKVDGSNIFCNESTLMLNASGKGTRKLQKLQLSEISDCQRDLQTKVSAKRKQSYLSGDGVPKRAKCVKEATDSDSSLSSQNGILYPSEVLKVINMPEKVPSPSHFVRSKGQNSADGYSSDSSRSVTHSVNKREPRKDSFAIVNQTRHKSVGRTLLTDPKPMERRPKRVCGREEWFLERSETENNSNKELHKNKKLFKEFSKKRTGSGYSQKEKEFKLKSHCQKLDRLRFQKTQEAVNNTKTTLTDSRDRNKAMPPVPRRPNNFSSRMGFLVDIPAKSDKCSIDKVAPPEVISRKKKQDSSRYRETMSPESKKKLNSSRNREVVSSESKRHEGQALFESLVPVKKYSSTQNSNTTNNNAIRSSVIPVQNSFVKSKEKLKPYLIGKEMCSNDTRIPETYFTSKATGERSSGGSESNIFYSASDSLSKENGELSRSKKTSNKCHQYYPYTSTNRVAVVSPIHQTSKEITKCHRNMMDSKCLLSSSTLLNMIVGWNPKWLEEQKKNKKPPPLISKGASHLHLSFASYETYASSYFPMIVLEVWESLFRESKPNLELEELVSWNNFYYIISSFENTKDITELRCESVVSESLSYQPSEGNIVLLDIRDREEHTIGNCIFGYVRGHALKDEFIHDTPEWKKMPPEWLDKAKLLKFSVCIKKTRQPVRLKSVYLGHGILNIKDKLQLADALHSFHTSPLCKDILHPREESFLFCDSSKKPLSRTDVIQAVSDEVRNPKSKSRVLLLRAPPGTGKTRCVIELVEKLIFGNYTKTKILICVPSYTAAGEIQQELVKLNQRLGLHSPYAFRFVIITKSEEICSKMREYSLEGKVERLYTDDCQRLMQQREKELKTLEQKINEILFQHHLSTGKYRKFNNSNALKLLVEQFKELKMKNLVYPLDTGSRKGYECIVLKESDVLLSTLESSMLPAVKTFLKDETLAYCIVDEASQCTELQLLQCLQEPQVERLILFGDPQQLPPMVVSKYATKCGYSRSTFERFCHHYKKRCHKVACHTFKVQHRMHSQICDFPSRYFYKSYNLELVTAEGINEKFNLFPLKPYAVLDVLEEESADTSSNVDDIESMVISYICSQLAQSAPRASVGVIMAGQEQKTRCRLALSNDSRFSDIEVNTLEMYQGREKDIVVLPCIRPFPPSDGETFLSCEKRFNVAITRARQCLVVCGNVSSLVQYPHWRALLDDAMHRNTYLCVASVKHIPLVFSNYIKKVH